MQLLFVLCSFLVVRFISEITGVPCYLGLDSTFPFIYGAKFGRNCVHVPYISGIT
jgi:hypothetical protein